MSLSGAILRLKELGKTNIMHTSHSTANWRRTKNDRI